MKLLHVRQTVGLSCGVTILALCAFGPSLSAQTSNEELLRRIDQLEREVRQLKAEVTRPEHVSPPAAGPYRERSSSTTRGYTKDKEVMPEVETETVRPAHLYVGGELVLVKPFYSSAFRAPQDSAHSDAPEIDYTATPRIWLGYEASSDSGLGARLTFWHFDGSDTSGQSFDSGPPWTTEIEATTVDGEVSQSGDLGHLHYRVSGGVRYGRLEYDTNVGRSVTDMRNREFEGVGPLVGLELTRPVGRTGFALTGGAKVAALLGDTDYSQTVGFGTATARGQLLPVYEGRLGVQWSHAFNRGLLSPSSEIALRVGYEAQYWQWPKVGNANGSPLPPPEEQPDIGFAGPVFGAEISF
jgi:hypothetical protein